MTYYIGEFSAKCFDDLQGQALIMSCKGVMLDHLALRHKERVHWTDNESISVTKASYLISLHSSYLFLPQGNHQVIQPYYPHQFSRKFGYPQDLPGSLLEIFCSRTLEAVYQHWESCTGTYSKVTIPHSLDEFSVTKAYADWWIRVCNPNKEILTTTCIEPPPDSSRQIPSKSLESTMRKDDSSVSTKENVKDNVKNDFNDLLDDSRASSKRSMGGHQTNTSTHSEHKETIFNGGSTHCHKTFKQHNNAQGLYVLDDDFENTSECHFKRRKIRPNPMY